MKPTDPSLTEKAFKKPAIVIRFPKVIKPRKPRPNPKPPKDAA